MNTASFLIDCQMCESKYTFVVMNMISVYSIKYTKGTVLKDLSELIPAAEVHHRTNCDKVRFY